MENNLYRINNDGSHFVGVKYIKTRSGDESILKNYTSEFCYQHGKPRIKRKSGDEESDVYKILKESYLNCLQYEKRDRLIMMKQYLKDHDYELSDDTINNFLSRQYKNLKNRVERFKKKALNNEWNYFVTITYDESKHDEFSFKEKLKKCLANLHTRCGYKYMGVFERSKIGRLHFHCLMNIPSGSMKGKIVEIKDYSTSDKKMRITHINTFFEKRFGRNDFVRINSKELMHDNTISYLLKYISKSDEPIFYSRGIATFLFLQLTNNDVVTCFGDLLIRYVLFDDILENNSLIKMRC